MRVLSIAAIAILLVSADSAQRVAAQSPAPLTQDVLRATLSNGLRVVIVRDPLAPVATEVVSYGAGSQDTPRGFPGTAHAVEHMVAGRSTETLSEDQIATIIALLGGSDNAQTQVSVTQYYINSPAKNLDVSLRIEAARMNGAKILQSEWSNERGAIEQEVSSDLSGAFYRYYEKATSVLFAGTPYDHTPLGTRASFNATTAALLKKFYSTWYRPNNALLVIAGDVDPEATLAHVKSIFGGIPRRATPAHAPVRLGSLPTGAVIRDTSDYPVPIELLTYRMPGYKSADYAATQIAVDVLSSERSALSDVVYGGKALGADVSYVPSPDAGLAFAYLESAPNSDPNASLKLLGDTIGIYQKDGAPPDLVEAAKRREIAQALFSRNSIEGLADEWSSAIAVQGLSSPDDILARYERVSVDDVNRVLRTYFNRDRAVVGILAPKPGAVPSSGGGGLVVKDTFAPKNLKPALLPSWAASLATNVDLPPQRITPADMMLANGLRLVVIPESISPTVTLVGRIRANPELQQSPGRLGVDGILSSLFSYGTTAYDRIDFQKELDAIAADISVGTSFSLEVPSKDADRGVQLLADDLLHPALPDDAFKIVQQQYAQSQQGVLSSPDYLAQRALIKGLVPRDDPTLRETTPQTIAAITPEVLRTYFTSVYRPDMTTIVVAGDITAEQAKSEVEKWFGSWSASGPKPEVHLPPIPLNDPSRANVTAPGRTQASVTLAEQVALTRDDPVYYALQLGDTVLGGAFYASRFSRDLRAQNGLVYSVGAGVSASKTRARYVVEYGCDPDKVASARAIIDRDLNDMGHARPPSPAELQQAKVQVVRDLELSESSVIEIARALAGLSASELPLDEPRRRAEAVVALTSEQVRAAFAKFVDPARFVQVIEGPAQH